MNWKYQKWNRKGERTLAPLLPFSFYPKAGDKSYNNNNPNQTTNRTWSPPRSWSLDLFENSYFYFNVWRSNDQARCHMTRHHEPLGLPSVTDYCDEELKSLNTEQPAPQCFSCQLPLARVTSRYTSCEKRNHIQSHTNVLLETHSLFIKANSNEHGPFFSFCKTWWPVFDCYMHASSCYFTIGLSRRGQNI